jgi:L-ribulose-5-phosphate 3-epimerase
MNGLGIFAWFSYPLPIEERFRMIKRAGFDATSLWWGDEDKQLQPVMARKLGLQIDNMHTPFSHPNDLWVDNLDGEGYLNMLIDCVSDCKKHDIPVAVVHITGFSDPPEISKVGIDRIKRLVDFAEKKDVYLAFENM